MSRTTACIYLLMPPHIPRLGTHATRMRELMVNLITRSRLSSVSVNLLRIFVSFGSIIVWRGTASKRLWQAKLHTRFLSCFLMLDTRYMHARIHSSRVKG